MSNGDLNAFFQDGQGFDTNSVEPQSDFNVVPPGKYPVMIDSAEVGETKSKTGHYVKLTLTILDGPMKNRKLWDYINIDNPNATTVEIAMRTLAALGQAIGAQVIADTSQLVGKACIASVKVKDDRNNIQTYLPLQQGTQVTRPAPVQQQAPPMQQTNQEAWRQQQQQRVQRADCQPVQQPMQQQYALAEPVQQPPVQQPLGVVEVPHEAPPPWAR